MINRKMAIGLLLALLLIPSVAFATDCPCTISNTTATGGAGSVGDVSNSEFWQAQTFKATGTGPLSGFQVQFGALVGTPSGVVTWHVYGDSLGQPDLEIASGTFTPTASAINTITVINGPTLNNGGLYWLSFTAAAQATDQRWQLVRSVDAASTYADGARYSSTNGAAWVVQTSDLYFVITIGALVATSTPAATSTPSDTATPTITPSPTPNYSIEVTSTAGSPMKFDRTMSFDGLTGLIGNLILAGLIFIAFAYTFWRRK